MGFTTETAREAGKASKRGKAKVSNELKQKLEAISDELLKSIEIHSLSNSDKIRLLQITISYILPKLKAVTIDNQDEDRLRDFEIRIIDDSGKVDRRLTLGEK